jgi:hypothetical protein
MRDINCNKTDFMSKLNLQLATFDKTETPFSSVRPESNSVGDDVLVLLDSYGVFIDRKK